MSGVQRYPPKAPIALSSAAEAIFDLSSPNPTQTLDLDTQAANKFLAGPTLGADAKPTFRSIVAADIPAATLEAGFAVLVAGTATVVPADPTLVDSANNVILLTRDIDAGTAGSVYVSTQTNGVSFVITSTNFLDIGTVGWAIIRKT